MSDSAANIKILIATLQTDFVQNFDYYEKLHGLKPKIKLQDSNPIAELKKLSQILKAHSTKIGIVSHPDKFHNNLDAAFKELQLFANAVFFLISLLPLFYQGQFTQYFTSLLDANILGLLNGISGLCDDLSQLLATPFDKLASDASGDSTEDSNSTPARLISIGKIWAACDSMLELATMGNLGLLNQKIQVSAKLVGDTLSEVEEWLLEPRVESDDPFGLDSDSDNDESGSTSETEPQEAPKEMIQFVQDWQSKLKMIRLLLQSFSKSIASNDYKNKEPTASQLDKLNELHKRIVAEIDELVSSTFMAGQDFDAEDEEIQDLKLQLNTAVREMAIIIKALNKDDEKKGKWIQVWYNKYFS
ncbi:LAME_0G10088g1_1 [Lachancea meyersii CBS 8951]|uniref:LAME_0G10088g1_1 n=1 Tax=Lachancea meyersii CBS 8951 TaxID=1266667 RepID=A0A1G4K8V1_9SACH|nr:LAME_0G10088g1_1 [Lachancea meyersii CBS 8951]